MDTHEVAGVAEDGTDVIRHLREPVSRTAPIAAACIDEPVAIGVDQATEQLVRMIVDQLLLPILEADQPLVLPSGSMLREQTGPGFPIRRDVDAVLVQALRDGY
jgi:hypothetical protein